jgi:hypothetical protein
MPRVAEAEKPVQSRDSVQIPDIQLDDAATVSRSQRKLRGM